jgi:hypothetical protein
MTPAQLKAKYGITDEDYDAMAEAQGYRCAICESDAPFVVDHCHQTGRVRGLLCHNCNVGLGHFKDNPQILTAALQYLGCKP